MIEFVKKNRRMLICTVLALIAGILIGASIVLSVCADQKSGVVRTEDDVLKEPSIVQKTTFAACGHTVAYPLENMGLATLDMQTIASRFPDSTVKQESDGTIIVVKESDNYCPEHFVLRYDASGALTIYKTNPQTAVPEEVRGLSGDVSLSESETLEELKQGIPFASMAEIDIYLENIES